MDLRSPREFAEDHLPGAVNVPLFDDRQRAVVGTLYAKESADAAYEAGLEMVEERLAGLLEEVLDVPVAADAWRPRFRELTAWGRDGRFQEAVEWTAPDPLPASPIVLNCWRGGMRSRSVVALLQALGERRAVHLSGGYKAYRAWVRQRLVELEPTMPLIVLRGPTGVGKTRILAAIEREAPGTTIDLEGFAQHRSSVLGDVGLAPVSQKAFETALIARLAQLGPPPWFVEGESRKVGDAVVPEPLFEAMEAAVQVRIDGSLEHRVGVLAADYLPTQEHASELRDRLPFLEKRLGKKWTGQLSAWLDQGDWRRVAEVLLERYYDPRYGHHDQRRRWALEIDAEQPQLVAQLLALRPACGGGGGASGG
ncbi:MAG: tRNA 2-selenouridine(34) synthase MnmH [Planctomycetes bacterium]|nr:tRNA 2-selenouridine(34) synthase MnmH [Planctomycetota bacterium]